MTLVSRQLEVARRIQDTLLSDPDLDRFPWQIRKLVIHRGAVWSPGAYIAPQRPVELRNETVIDKIMYPFLIACIEPVEQDLENTMDFMGAIERVEDIFRNKGNASAPRLIRDMHIQDPDNLAFQLSTIATGERFIAGALQLGYDASATIVQIHVNVPRRKVRSLGPVRAGGTNGSR